MGISWGCGAVESVATALLIMAWCCVRIYIYQCSFVYLSSINFAFVGASWVSCLNNISTSFPLKEGYSDVLEQQEPLLWSPSKSTSDLAHSGVLCQTARIPYKLLNSPPQRHHPHPHLSRAAAQLISGNWDTSPSTPSVSTTILRTHTQVVLALALGDQDYTVHRV